MQRVLVTGACGFIGFHLCDRLLASGHEVLGVDNLCDDGALALKRHRMERLSGRKGLRLRIAAIESPGEMAETFDHFRPEIVVHLAARAGVRQSSLTPAPYIDSNITGTFALLEAARAHPPQHLLMASSSSVYGAGNQPPFAESEQTDHPISIYAATKKAAEALAHSYAHLFDLPITMLRFFTVYGPWGRPDMAMIRFSQAMLAGEEIALYNHGQMQRDFTYIADLVEAVRLLMAQVPGHAKICQSDTLSPVARYRQVNIGTAQTVRLDQLIDQLEMALGVTAKRRYAPLQPGDMIETGASQALLQALTGFAPQTPLEEGLRHFAAWYRAHLLPS